MVKKMKEKLKVILNLLHRGTVGGCFATALGAVIHELGHCLDLEHTLQGMMARGFDDMDNYFLNCSKQPSVNPSTIPFCSNHSLVTSPTKDDKLTGKELIELYHPKKIYQKIRSDFGGAFWERSCALILHNHRYVSLGSNFLLKQHTLFSDG